MPISYSSEKLAELLVGQWLQKGVPGAIEYLLIDSRHLQRPGLSLFFAIDGPHHDGHDFIPELYTQGVRFFVIERSLNTQGFPEANFWLVSDTVGALQRLAAHHRRQFQLPVIGITGSNGKTIVKEWLFQLLHQDFHIVRSPKSYNSQVGVPLSVWQIDASHELGIFEAGISKMAEMERIAPVIQCTIGLFTTLGEAHSEGFASVEEKLRQKLLLFQSADVIIYCRSHTLVHRAVQAMDKPAFSWSLDEAADMSAAVLGKTAQASKLLVSSRYGEFSFSIPFTDDASVENALHCCAAMLYLGIPKAAIQQRMARLEPVAMRLEVHVGINGCSIVNDSYNLDLTGLEAALAYLNRQHYHRKRTLILSDILQTGMDREQLYARAGQLIGDYGIQRFFGIGSEVPAAASHLPPDTERHFFSTTDEFLDRQHHSDFSNEIILVKGARPFAFERIARRLSQKVHQTELEVDLGAFLHNVRAFQRRLAPTTKVMVMVKAAAYGSGSLEVARALEFHKVDYLAVAYADEGIELREGGIQLPIVVLNPEEAVFDGILRYQLEPEIYSLRLLRAYGQFTRETPGPSPIHLKLDTGMHRLGLEEENLADAVDLLRRFPQLEVRSVFSHLAASEAPEHDAFTHQQAGRFGRFYEQLASGIDYRPLRHLLNSSGIARFSQYQMDMVRLGLGAYGIDASGLLTKELRPALTLRARISQIRALAAGESVSYGRSGRIDRDSRIATISIGYADGLLRAAGNGRFAVLIRGQRAPIIGNVCMDMCMVDVTGIPEAQEGDEVTLFGASLPVQELADAMKTIPYEVLASISPRVRRLYVQE